MIEKQAIERLKCMKLFMQINDKDNESKFLDKDYEANAMAISALEKQIPIKPIGKYNVCPKCGVIEFGFNEPNYCEWCGQKIDWSEVSE